MIAGVIDFVAQLGAKKLLGYLLMLMLVWILGLCLAYVSIFLIKEIKNELKEDD